MKAGYLPCCQSNQWDLTSFMQWKRLGAVCKPVLACADILCVGALFETHPEPRSQTEDTVSFLELQSHSMMHTLRYVAFRQTDRAFNCAHAHVQHVSHLAISISLNNSASNIASEYLQQVSIVRSLHAAACTRQGQDGASAQSCMGSSVDCLHTFGRLSLFICRIL